MDARALVRRLWVPAAVLAAIVAAFALVALTGAPVPPVIVLRAQWLPASLPTATAWYDDGAREDLTPRLHTEWRPDRPLRLVTLVAAVGCEIEVDGRVVSSDRATRGQYAVCAWVAP